MCRQARTSARARIPLQPRLQDVLEALPLPDVPEAEPPGDDPPEDPLEYADLSFSERAVLQPLMALHIPHRNQLLTAIQSPDFNPQDIRFRNAKQLQDYMASHHTEVGFRALCGTAPSSAPAGIPGPRDAGLDTTKGICILLTCNHAGARFQGVGHQTNHPGV